MSTVTLEVDCGWLGEGVAMEFTVDYRPGTPDVMYLRNGDPGYPGDPPELEVEAVWCNGVDVTKAFDFGGEALRDALVEKAREAYDAEQEEAQIARDEARAEARRGDR